jgi:hypothetical protein
LTLAAAKLRFNDSDKKNRTAVMLLLAALSPNPWVLAKSRKSESGSADCWAKKHRVISVAACKHEAGEENKEQKGKQKESVFEGASERLSERERQTDTQTRKKWMRMDGWEVTQRTPEKEHTTTHIWPHLQGFWRYLIQRGQVGIQLLLDGEWCKFERVFSHQINGTSSHVEKLLGLVGTNFEGGLSTSVTGMNPPDHYLIGTPGSVPAGASRAVTKPFVIILIHGVGDAVARQESCAWWCEQACGGQTVEQKAVCGEQRYTHGFVEGDRVLICLPLPAAAHWMQVCWYLMVTIMHVRSWLDGVV